MAPALDREYIRPGDRVCAAVSGGADSVAMLLLLATANSLPRNGLGVGLSVAHVHHGLRGAEADADLDFVRELCDRLKIPLHMERVDTAAHAASHRETIEEAARTLRYGFLERLIGEGSADSVLTAHTLDDQAETVLMKLLRGAWTEGLSGISPVIDIAKPRRGRIVRPLLGVRRAELRAFLETQGQAWREDASNADEAFTRNRIRHRVLPLLREENPAIDEVLAKLAELARADEAHWKLELGRVLPQLLLPGKPVRGGGRTVATGAGGAATVAIELERLRLLEPALRPRVVRAAARSLGARLSFDETARLLALAGLGGESAIAARTGSKIHLTGGLRAERSARELRLYIAGPASPLNPTA